MSHVMADAYRMIFRRASYACHVARFARVFVTRLNLAYRTDSPAVSRLLFPSQFQEISSYRDEFTVFAEHVAIRLKNITDVRARLVAQHQINNILFEAEMGKYNAPSYNSVEMMENLDEPSTSNEEKVLINMPHTI